MIAPLSLVAYRRQRDVRRRADRILTDRRATEIRRQLDADRGRMPDGFGAVVAA